MHVYNSKMSVRLTYGRSHFFIFFMLLEILIKFWNDFNSANVLSFSSLTDSFTYRIINQSIIFSLQGALFKITTDESLLPESKTMSLFLCKDLNLLQVLSLVLYTFWVNMFVADLQSSWKFSKSSGLVKFFFMC